MTVAGLEPFFSAQDQYYSKDVHMNFPIGGAQPIFPEELGTLRIVFSQLCEEHEILTTSVEAGELASELVRLFQTGIK
ncbi:hypothetical protein EOB59_35140, partial [Mesorhizobium sp. M7A.F.Ca.MR.176.00.0.0]